MGKPPAQKIGRDEETQDDQDEAKWTWVTSGTEVPCALLDPASYFEAPSKSGRKMTGYT